MFFLCKIVRARFYIGLFYLHVGEADRRPLFLYFFLKKMVIKLEHVLESFVNKSHRHNTFLRLGPNERVLGWVDVRYYRIFVSFFLIKLRRLILENYYPIRKKVEDFCFLSRRSFHFLFTEVLSFFI